jgi:hypothetical protein
MSDLPHIAVVGGGISVADFGELPAAMCVLIAAKLC